MTEYAVIDFETRSLLDVRKVGAWRYSLDPSTDILCLGYSINGEAPEIWYPELGYACPEDLSWVICGDGLVWAHNATFELAIWENVIHGHRAEQFRDAQGHPWPTVKRHRWADTMASCAYRSLPLKLEKAAQILKLPTQKDMAGHRIMQQLSKPKRDGLFEHDPEKHQINRNYCRDDVKAEYELLRKTGPLPAPEHKVWLLDQTINRRGIGVDLGAVEAGLDIMQQIEGQLHTELQTLTKGDVETAGQVAKIKAWITQQTGSEMPDLQAETVDEWLSPQSEVPDNVRRVLEIRQELGRAATKKLETMKRCAVDGRLYDLCQYHGANTGRWAGRLTQPHNFVRPQLNDGDGVDPEQIIRDIKTRDVEYLEMVYGSATVALSDAMRPMLWAGEDGSLVGADLSGIEARVLPWVAGETWKIEAFKRIDEGKERDIYCQTADKIFRFTVEKKTHPLERQVGKICELAFGYQGGVGAWRGFDTSDRHTDEEVDEYKNAWREKHPNVVQFWWGLDRAAVQAMVEGYGEYAGIIYRKERNGRYLSCELPGGRKLWYNFPELKETQLPWDPTKTRLTVTYKAWRFGQWITVYGYGGLWTENVVQAISRDILVVGMFNAEAAALPIVLTVHDELVTQPPGSWTDHKLKELEKILVDCMTDLPTIYDGLPVSARPWSGKRYWK